MGVLGILWDESSCFSMLDMGHWIALDFAFGTVSWVGIWCLDTVFNRVGMACGVSDIVHSTFPELAQYF